MKSKLKAPFPYFGGKSRIASEVWRRFGDVDVYVEPFFGTGAVLLGRPTPFRGTETVNDIDGMICNFWRAVKGDPDGVAKYADWPAIENDVNSRHAWLVAQKDSLQERLEGDPGYYDAKIAGWWCWGMSLWIIAGFCTGKGPWRVQEISGVRKLVQVGGDGAGIMRKRIHLGGGRGVVRRTVLEGHKDRGPGSSEHGIYAWMEALSRRLRRVRVCCGDWKGVCGGWGGDALESYLSGSRQLAVFLDPPYSESAGRAIGCYSCDDGGVAYDALDWAVKHGTNDRIRIALCGYDGEHVLPDDWEAYSWKTLGGFSNISSADTQGKFNKLREMVWFSPHCKKGMGVSGFGLGV